MANHKSSKARILRNAKVTTRKSAARSTLRTSVKKVDLAVASGDAAAARQALKDAQPKLQRAGAKKLVNKKAAARKLSRLSARVKKLGAA
jgi:small subunit ribosomal protein S20